MKNIHLLCLTVALQSSFGITAAFAADGTAPEPQKVATARADGGDEEVQLPKNFGHSSSLVSTSQCKINCTAPHAACSESAQVLSIVQDMYKALSEHDLAAVGKHIDENCTKFDQGTGKLIVGRQAILDDLKTQLEKLGPDSKTPLLSYTIDHPYAHVSGDNAVVTFTAYKELGGDHPKKFESHCTDIFKREGTSWMKISYRSNWKEINL